MALSVGAPGTTATGLPEYLVRYGRARIVEGGAVPRHQRLAQLYMGSNADFPPPAVRVLDGYVTRIAPERIAGVGPWAPHR